MVDPADPSGGGVVGGVQAALRVLASVDPLGVSDAERAEAVVELHRVRSTLEAVAAPWTRAWELSRSWSSDQHRRHRAGRKAHHSKTFRGTWELTATFDPVGGEMFDTALGRLYLELLKADWAQIRAEHGDAATTDLLPRTVEQRRADALVEMARRAMAVAPDAKLPRPLITVRRRAAMLVGCWASWPRSSVSCSWAWSLRPSGSPSGRSST